MQPVFITRLSSFLPGKPVDNEQIEEVLGQIGGKPSKAKALVLRNNGIKKRYYALEQGRRTHNNAGMAAEAVRLLFDTRLPLDSLELLAAGTSTPDQILPSHASMVHGELGIGPLELISAGGSCCSSIGALKYAWMSVAAGFKANAAVCGSEAFSNWLTADRFKAEADTWKEMATNPYIAFEKDFLRWMLSDGAAAVLLEPQRDTEGLSLRIEWLEITSFAHELETCMYAGAIKNPDGSLTGWNSMTIEQWAADSVFAIKQDTRLLGANIIRKGGEFLASLMKKYNISETSVDWYLPHMSSEFFKKEMSEGLERAGMHLPAEKWFYNLTQVGNVGSASPFLMLEELFHSGRLQRGQHILVMIPESARFTYGYLYLTVV